MYSSETKKLENVTIHISKPDNRITLATSTESLIEGIITGSIINILFFPLFLVGIAAGIWIIVLALVGKIPFLLIFMGVMFVMCSVAPLYMLIKSQAAFFPYQCRFKRSNEGQWYLQRRLGILNSRWQLLENFSIVAIPAYMRGDWGYGMMIKTDKRRFMLTPPGVFTESKVKARAIAEKDSQIVANYLGVDYHLEKWENTSKRQKRVERLLGALIIAILLLFVMPVVIGEVLKFLGKVIRAIWS